MEKDNDLYISIMHAGQHSRIQEIKFSMEKGEKEAAAQTKKTKEDNYARFIKSELQKTIKI
jgi:hypothetical protein